MRFNNGLTDVVSKRRCGLCLAGHAGLMMFLPVRGSQMQGKGVIGIGLRMLGEIGEVYALAVFEKPLPTPSR